MAGNIYSLDNLIDECCRHADKEKRFQEYNQQLKAETLDKFIDYLDNSSFLVRHYTIDLRNYAQQFLEGERKNGFTYTRD